MKKGQPIFKEENMVRVQGPISAVAKGLLTEKELDELVGSYDPTYSEASVTITHEKGKPKTWASFGWVTKLWKKGKELMAEMLMLPELIEILEKGLIKKRSIGFFKDSEKGKWYLGHVAFLGSELPAIKGMPDLTYSDPHQCERVVELDDALTDEKFHTIGNFLDRLRDLLIEEYGTEKANGVISRWTADFIAKLPPKDEPGGVVFNQKSKEVKLDYTKEIVDALVAQAVSDAKVKWQSEQENAITELNTTVEGLKAKVATLEKDKTKLEGEVQTFSVKAIEAKAGKEVAGLIQDGRIPPTQEQEITDTLVELHKLDGGEEKFARQLAIYKKLSKMEFGAGGDAGAGGENRDGVKSTYSLVENLGPAAGADGGAK